jgi:hypothetical protein
MTAEVFLPPPAQTFRPSSVRQKRGFHQHATVSSFTIDSSHPI